MNKFYITICLFLVFLPGTAQVGINTTTPKASLDIQASNPTSPSNTEGILIPKVDALPSTNPTAAQHGVMLFLTTTSGSYTPGFYYWDSNATTWKGIGTDTGWALKGNTGTTASTNFLGTTDDIDLVIKRNSTRTGLFGTSRTFLGLNAGLLNTGVENVAVGNGALASNVGLTAKRLWEVMP